MRPRGPSLIVLNTSSCTPQAWDMQLGYIDKPTSMQSRHIQTFMPCYTNSHMTHVHIQETLCNQRAATAPICSQLLDTHKPMSMKNPAHGPVDIVDIHARISPPGMQIPRKCISVQKWVIAPQSALWVSGSSGPDLSITDGQSLKRGHGNAHGFLDVSLECSANCVHSLLCTYLAPKSCTHTHTHTHTQPWVPTVPHVHIVLVPWCWGPGALERPEDCREEGPWF